MFILLALSFGYLSPLFSHADSFQEVREMAIYDTTDLLPPDSNAIHIQEHLKKARPGGEIKISTDKDYDSLYPYKYRDGVRYNAAPLVNDFVYQRLMEEDISSTQTTILKPSLAQKVELNPAKKQVRVTLRPEAHFSDGSPITFEDIAFSWELYRDHSKSKFLIKLNYGDNVQLSKVSDRQFLVEFPNISNDLFRETAFNFLGEVRVVKPISNVSGIELSHGYMGSGPYRVVRATHTKLILERDPGFWLKEYQGLYNADRITCTYIHDPTTRRLTITAREANIQRETNKRYVDWMYSKSEQGDKFRTSDQQIISTSPYAKSMVLWFNLSHPHVRNPAFRQALNLVWNSFAVDNALSDGLEASSSPGSLSRLRPHGAASPETMEILRKIQDPLAQEAMKPYEQFGYEWFAPLRKDRERLRQAVHLLSDAGYSFTESDGRAVLTYDGKPVRLQIVYFSDEFSRTSEKRIEIFSSFAKAIGIDFLIHKTPDLAAKQRMMVDNDYDLTLGWVELPRSFNFLNVQMMKERFFSKSGVTSNIPRLNSPIVDQTLMTLSGMSPKDPQYGPNADAFLRAISAYMPFIILGEVRQSTVYTDPDLCLLPAVVQEELLTDERTVKAAYFGCARPQK